MLIMSIKLFIYLTRNCSRKRISMELIQTTIADNKTQAQDNLLQLLELGVAFTHTHINLLLLNRIEITSKQFLKLVYVNVCERGYYCCSNLVRGQLFVSARLT